jgi:integrative and conjugative element protein (TIGR02256 family)
LDVRFEIKEVVLDTLRGYAQHEGNEMCGVLTGSQIDEKTFRISKVSPPCVAHNSRCGCERDAVKANEFISLDYEESEHTRVYVGEWHTHPEKNPSPSGTDCNSIISNFVTSEICVSFLLMIIVGTESIYYSIYNGSEFVTIVPQIVD